MQVDKMFPVVFHEGEIGLELEVESKKNRLPLISDNMWTTKNEGSLRNFGMEYVSIGALWNNVEKAKHIHNLIKKLPIKDVDKDSPRTSLHVHVNVQKYSIEQLYTLMCAYWLFENILVKFSGPEREGNHFCLRLSDAEYLMKQVLKDLKANTHFHTMRVNRHLRYSAMNLASIPMFGSVEFRSMRGTVDPDLIDFWSSELHLLCFRAKKLFTNPAELMDRYFALSKEEFMSAFFSTEFCRHLKAIKNWKDLISENEGLLCELAYVKDWSIPFPKLKKEKVPIQRTRGLIPQPLLQETTGMTDPLSLEEDDELLRLEEEERLEQERMEMEEEEEFQRWLAEQGDPR